MLKKGLLQKFVWEIDFSLAIARKSIERADVSRIEKAFTLLAADRLAIAEAIAVLEEVKRDTEALGPL
jgi:hypothetical protein